MHTLRLGDAGPEVGLLRATAAERRARPKWIPSAIYDLGGPDAAARWEATPMSARRVIVKALLTGKIHRRPRATSTSRSMPTPSR